MNRLSKQKRNQIVAVVLCMALVVAGLWFYLIGYQLESLRNLDASKQALEKKLSQVLDTKKNSSKIETELAAAKTQLATMETEMASGDVYSSMVNSIRKFKASHKVEIPEFKSGVAIVDVNVLPRFPYKQFTVSISGAASYNDLGKFIADFENEFPTSRIMNLDVAPGSMSGPEDKEKLAFKMDIVALVKGSAPVPAKEQYN